MQINKFNTRDASNTPKPMSLKDPFSRTVIKDEDGKTIDIYVYGRDSDAARNARRDRERKYGSNPDSDKEEMATAELAAGVTQGWSPNLEDANGPISFTRDAAVNLYEKEQWIAAQVLSFSLNLSNFDPLR